MSTPVASSPSSFSRYAAPAAALLLIGIVPLYALHSAKEDDRAPMLREAPTVVSEAKPVEAAEARFVPARLASARRPATRADSAVFRDLASGMAQLHAGISAPPVAAGERNRVVADLDNRHDAEAIDPVWSATLEQGLAQASESQVMAQAGFHPQDVSTDCRSKSCRVSARFDNPGEARDWADRLLTQMAGTIGQARVAVLPQADGSFEVRVYGARRS